MYERSNEEQIERISWIEKKKMSLSLSKISQNVLLSQKTKKNKKGNRN